jgi:hypothetical protein
VSTNEPIDWVEPKKRYFDDLEIYDGELGLVPAWKALIYHGVKAKQALNDSTSSAALSMGFAESAPQGYAVAFATADAVPDPEALAAATIADAEDAEMLASIMSALEAAEQGMSELDAVRKARVAFAAEAARLADSVEDDQPIQ